MLLANQYKDIINKILNRKLLIWLGLIFFAYALGTSLAYFLAPSALPKVYNFARQNPEISVNTQALKPISDFAIIKERNLFALNSHQSSAPVAPATVEAVAPVIPTGTVGILPLDARLVGTVDINNPALSRAIIVYEGLQRIVRVGQVFAGYNVKSIKRNEVIFELNGTELKLEQKLLK